MNDSTIPGPTRPNPPVITSITVTVIPDSGALEADPSAPKAELKPFRDPRWSWHVHGEVRIAKPPRLWWSWVAGMLMSPAGYRAYFAPHVADMHEQYFECLKRGNLWGARRAVIRANLYAVPSWIWGVIAHVLVRVIAWIRT